MAYFDLTNSDSTNHEFGKKGYSANCDLVDLQFFKDERIKIFLTLQKPQL